MFLQRVGYFGLLNVMTLKDILGGYSDKVPPLPIPNREVKLVRADGTASSGRVGRRRILKSPVLQRAGDFCVRVVRESKIDGVNYANLYLDGLGL